MRRTEIIPFEKTQEAMIYVKRDDLIPFSFGGNKVRIAEEVFRFMEENKMDTVVSYGSATSNLNRVIAHMAAVKGKHCCIIIKKEPIQALHPSFNEIMVLDSGAEIIYTEPEDVRETVRNTLTRLKYRGLKPYYIYGDESGQGGEVVLSLAYQKAFREIRQQEEKMNLHFDHICVPVGTGSTLAGLAASCDDAHDILGISIARKEDRVREILRGTLEKIHAEEPEKLPDVEAQMSRCRITDQYLMGGYGHYGKALGEFIDRILKNTGMPLDPCYSGKAYFGLTGEIAANRLSGNCLFIHTGGLPLFFDYCEQR